MLAHRLSALVLVSALAACGGDDGAVTPQGAADYCEAIAPFFCDFYVRCGRMDVATVEACTPAFLESCNGVFEPRYVELEAAGLLALDAGGIAACRAHLATVACDQQIQELDGPCAGMWQGQQAAGEACGLDVEYFTCAPDTACVLGLDFCGTCRPLAGVGDACEPGVTTCGPDAFCDGALCVARVPNGGACGPDDRCLTGAVCDAGVCTPPAFVGRGDACDQRRRCPYLTACVGGTCQPTVAVGGACTGDTQCELEFCDAGTCAVPRASGEACARPNQCASGLCDGGTCQARPSACIAE